MRSYYFVFKAPPKSSIKQKLQGLGASQVKGTFWGIPKNRVETARNLIGETAIFRRTRSLAKPQIVDKEQIFDLGSLTLVVYKTCQPQVKVRVAVSKMLKKTLVFRVARGVYAFPQVKYSRFRGKILTSSDFVRQLEKIGGEVHTFPNLILMYPQEFAKSLLDQVEERIIDESKSIVQTSRNLAKEIMQTEKLEGTYKKMSELKSRLTSLRNTVYLLHKIYRQNLKNHVSRAYAAISTCRSAYKKRVS